MIYNFDEIIDRRGTSAIKLEWLQQMWGRTDLLPLWVADMDFATAPFVTEAIKRRLETPVLGYTAKPDSYYRAIIRWVKDRYGLEARKRDINLDRKSVV